MTSDWKAVWDKTAGICKPVGEPLVTDRSGWRDGPGRARRGSALPPPKDRPAACVTASLVPLCDRSPPEVGTGPHKFGIFKQKAVQKWGPLVRCWAPRRQHDAPVYGDLMIIMNDYYLHHQDRNALHLAALTCVNLVQNQPAALRAYAYRCARGGKGDGLRAKGGGSA